MDPVRQIIIVLLDAVPRRVILDKIFVGYCPAENYYFVGHYPAENYYFIGHCPAEKLLFCWTLSCREL
ncbi:MAG: hypothetical protein MJE68_19575, partial [Proteobacteria bacterium]|nr:hypothetical protein [Pseudomonadota bacterium]